MPLLPNLPRTNGGMGRGKQQTSDWWLGAARSETVVWRLYLGGLMAEWAKIIPPHFTHTHSPLACCALQLAYNIVL